MAVRLRVFRAGPLLQLATTVSIRFRHQGKLRVSARTELLACPLGICFVNSKFAA